MTDIDSDFYLAFENRFRGDAAEVVRKSEVYAPLLSALEHKVSKPICVDLGCGRGEWLKFLQSRGWAILGVDQSEIMIAACKSQDLCVHQADVIEHLRSLDDKSVDLVTAFHVIEHLPFEALVELCQEAQRVVKTKGAILYESPNPENLLVGTDRFYLDPTHIRPLPPDLMVFLMQWAGAAHCRAVRIHSEREYDPGHLLGQQFETFLNYSRDYALIATGNSLVFDSIDLMAGDAGPSTSRLYVALNELHDSLNKTDQGLRQQIVDMRAEVARLLAQVDEQSRDLVLLKHRSLGWRLANLKHRVQGIISALFGMFRRYPSKTLEHLLARFAGIVRRHPLIKQAAVKILRSCPRLLAWVTRRLAPTVTLTRLQAAYAEDRYPLVTEREMLLADAVAPSETDHS